MGEAVFTLTTDVPVCAARAMVCAPAHRAQPMTTALGRKDVPDEPQAYTGSLTWATAGIFFAIAALVLLALGLIINVAYGADNARLA